MRVIVKGGEGVGAVSVSGLKAGSEGQDKDLPL